MVCLLALAAERAARSPRAAGVHGWAWLVLVPGLPLLASALELGGLSTYGAAPSWLTPAAHASPLAWAWRRAVAGASAADGAAPWSAIAVCFGLWALAELAGGREARAPAGTTAP